MRVVMRRVTMVAEVDGIDRTGKVAGKRSIVIR